MKKKNHIETVVDGFIQGLNALKAYRAGSGEETK